MAQGRIEIAKDHLALSAVMVEQAAVDNNHWRLAWLLCLLDAPLPDLWVNQGKATTGSQAECRGGAAKCKAKRRPGKGGKGGGNKQPPAQTATEG